MDWSLFLLMLLQYGFSRAPPGSPSKYNNLPNIITMTLRYSRTGIFTFHLEKISDNVDKAKVVVGNENGVRVSPQDPNKHYSMYKDSKYQATFTISEHRFKNRVGYLYYGAFRYGNKEYTLEPTHPNDLKMDNAFDKDYVVKIDNLSYHLREHIESTHGGYDRSLTFPMDTRNINQYRKGNNRKFVGDKQLLTIELLVVLDYSIYSKWMKFMNNNQHQAIENMKYYYTEVVNVIKLKYEYIEMPKYKFTVALAGFYIAETPEMIPFVENPKAKLSEYEIKYDEVLQGFSRWINSSVKYTLPRFDVATLFTNYVSPGFNGVAIVSGVCSTFAVSFTKDNGPFKTGDTATHEIGHNLGAQHDGEGNNCRHVDHHVMVSGKDPLSENNYNNTFYFSNCSLKYFLSKIYKMNRNNQNCLEDYPESSISLDTSSLFNGSVGQKLSPDEQCKMVIGPKSRLCSRGKMESSNLCFSISCKVRDGRCFPIIPAFGTSCGRKSWCVKGKCVRDEKAPEFRDHCLLGDSTDSIDISTGSTTCKELITQNPKYCSQTYYKDLCCESCGKIKTNGNKNCPYGDQNPKCDVKYCVSPYYRIGCCKTCKVSANENLPQGRCEDEGKTSWCRNPTGHTCYKDRDLCCVGCAMIYNATAQGCEYGDRSSWCYDRIKADSSQCASEQFSKPCCHSCEKFRGQNVNPTNPTTAVECIDKEDCSYATSYTCYQMESDCCATCKKFLKRENDKNCKYGDRFDWCSSYVTGKMECQSAESIEDCCQSCRPYVKR